MNTAKVRLTITRDSVIPFILMALSIAGLGLAALLASGCATFATASYKTLDTADLAVGVASDALNPACLAEQRAAINKPNSNPAERTAAVAASEKRCQTAAKAISSAHEAIVFAKKLLEGIRAGIKTPADAIVWVVLALNTYSNLTPVLAVWNIKLPGVK